MKLRVSICIFYNSCKSKIKAQVCLNNFTHKRSTKLWKEEKDQTNRKSVAAGNMSCHVSINMYKLDVPPRKKVLSLQVI